MGFSRQEYWSGVQCPPSGIEPASFTTSALVGRFFTTSAIWEMQSFIQVPAQKYQLLLEAFPVPDPPLSVTVSPLITGPKQLVCPFMSHVIIS